MTLKPALYDTDPLSQVSVSLDIGIIPTGYPNAGQWIVTIQAHPLPGRKAAETVAIALKEAIEARLQIRLAKEGTQ